MVIPFSFHSAPIYGYPFPSLTNVLMLFMYLEMMGKSLSLIWDDLEVMTDNSTEILKFCKIHVQ